MTEEKEQQIEGLPELRLVGQKEEEPEAEPELEAEETAEAEEKEKKKETAEVPFQPDAEPHLYAIRTTVGKENTVAEFLTNRIRLEKLDISSIMAPAGLKGYVFVESCSRPDVLRAIHNIQHIRGLISGEVAYTEIGHYLEARTTKTIPEKALVELVSGPFKGEKAKVVRIDTSKDSVTVELIEATVPIPITVKMDAVRVLAEDATVLQSKEMKGKEEEGEE